MLLQHHSHVGYDAREVILAYSSLVSPKPANYECSSDMGILGNTQVPDFQ